MYSLKKGNQPFLKDSTFISETLYTNKDKYVRMVMQIFQSKVESITLQPVDQQISTSVVGYELVWNTPFMG